MIVRKYEGKGITLTEVITIKEGLDELYKADFQIGIKQAEDIITITFKDQ